MKIPESQYSLPFMNMKNEKTTIVSQTIETPIGDMICCAVDSGLCLLEFTDRRMLEDNLSIIQKRFKGKIKEGSNEHIERLSYELNKYFAGTLRDFTIALSTNGTPFQERVWNELCNIPYGSTCSYEELAINIGDHNAVRAVAGANGMNRISILIPCHRVIGKDGKLTGYGGGLWRKRYLLDLEGRGEWLFG